jgi:hypothetical protein
MSRTSLRARRAGLTSAGALLALAVLAGCSSDTSSDEAGTASSPSQDSSSTTGTSADVCADLDTAKASLQALADTNIAQDGTTTLKARLTTVESDLQTVLDSAKAQFATQTTDVKSSLSTLDDSVAGLWDDPNATTLASVKTSLAAVKTSTQDLLTSVGDTC